MRDYSRGKIYKIINNVNNKIYVGSTIYYYLSTRFNTHKQCCRGGGDSDLYRAMREIGIKNFKIQLIKRFPCKTKQELLDEENRVTNSFPRDILYNMNFDGRISEVVKQKLSLAKLMGGGVCKLKIKKDGKIYSYWRFQWVEDGKHKAKIFSIKKYGDKKAFELANEYMETYFL